MTEKQLQQAVLELALWLGWRAYHTFDSRRSQPGFPDLVLLRRTRLLFVELKRERGKLSAEQREWLEALDHAGNETHVWRPIDWLSGAVESCLRLDNPS